MLKTYLNQRETELEKEGGKDSLSYKREAKIVRDLIDAYKLPVATPSPQLPTPPTELRAHVFCNSCGSKNSSDSKFCSQCGKQLVRIS